MDSQQAQPAPPQQDYDPHAKVGNALTVTQPGERTVCEIKRHPIGMLGIYIIAGILIVAMAVIGFLVLPKIISGSQGTAIGAMAFLLVAILTLAFVFISNKVYWGNSWVLTTDSLTQIDQNSLFNRESSQLSLGNLEDVTAEQNGILPHLFNYGWIRVETASERGKFVFQYCPNPNYYAQQILSARESFEQNRRGEDLQRPYRTEGSYAPPGQAGDPGYGAVQPLQTQGPAPQQPGSQPDPALGSADYPDESADQGVNINS